MSMDFEWVAIALGDVAWISLAFSLGFLARLISLPPLVGFLATGFILNFLGIGSGEMLQNSWVLEAERCCRSLLIWASHCCCSPLA